MAARRRSHKTRDLPPNLYVRNDGYYSYRDPRTGKEYGLGRDKRYAVTQAIEANMSMVDSPTASLIERMSGQGNISFYVWADKYYEILIGRDLKSKTLTDYADRIKAIRNGIPDMHLNQVSTRTIADFIGRYESQGKSTTAKLIRSTLLDMFRSAIAEGYINNNPVSVTRNPRTKVKRSRLSLDDYRVIISKSAGMPEWISLSIRVALLTGQRVSDISEMKWDSVADGFMRVEQLKTGAKLAIPLNLKLSEAGLIFSDLLSECRLSSPGEYVVGTKKGERIAPRTISGGFSRLRSDCGLSWNGAPPSFHELRSLSARLHTKENGAEFAQRLLGHKSAQMTDRYRDSRGSEWDIILS
ncbi:phage integrase Arm DNA-binding domain-containing protein [Erwinia tracheiphila]|uniref:Integrase n=1 Tax=Erwinia tracheiphila TaxID=65700 RepID=A0A0M2KIZ5_9GAMM|nr:tyrosine-type recombinase/integrase [Erwinia tracheiphila]EOS94699.1 putative integrase [Erwinia tracheiphila PSU-1]KKF36966.1 integrase [Erwinia tracheiphila]UIA88312.1 phage integrase Arm DNA-binding domain-containing protein [Erwinia tracheiphila]UIA96267.1 phage integrase Arm DNA-binding domain-containing protein [Erwinia tracheiphila]